MCFNDWKCLKNYFKNYPYSKIRFIISAFFLLISKIFLSIGGRIYGINFSWNVENKKNNLTAMKGEYVEDKFNKFMDL